MGISELTFGRCTLSLSVGDPPIPATPPPQASRSPEAQFLLVQFHFLTGQTRAGSASPSTSTGWLSAAVASVLVRKIKKEVKEAEAVEVPAVGESGPDASREGPPPPASHRRPWVGAGPGQSGHGFSTCLLRSLPLRGECGEECGLWQFQFQMTQLCVWVLLNLFVP